MTTKKNAHPQSSHTHTHLAELEDDVVGIIVSHELEVFHRCLGYSAVEVEAVRVELSRQKRQQVSVCARVCVHMCV